MMRTIRNCDECGREYYADDPKKPGRFSVCGACGADGEVGRVHGFTVQDGKNDQGTQIMSREKFDAIKKLARVGIVVTH
jgi:hypothetical protein